MKCAVKLYVAGKVFEEVVYAVNYDDARKTAISIDLLFTNIIIEEIILNAATVMMRVKIINITFLSTFKAFIKE